MLNENDPITGESDSGAMNLADAIRLEREGRLLEAEAICRQVLDSEPARVEAHHLLGTILYQQGDNDQAIEVMRRAIALAPDAPQLRVNLATLLGKSVPPRQKPNARHVSHARLA
jgi:Flp pilus assembly protein TadD